MKKNNKTPKLRFSGYTDDWEQRKLGDIAEFSKGSGYSKGDLIESGTPIILYGRLYTKYETSISEVDTYVEAKDGSVYTNTTQVQFDKHTLHSNNLYQIFTYVKNREYQFGDEDNKVSGMLLYARTDALIQPDNVYQMHGNQISVKTLDLNKPFDEIAKQLDEIAATHFEGIEKTI